MILHSVMQVLNRKYDFEAAFLTWDNNCNPRVAALTKRTHSALRSSWIFNLKFQHMELRKDILSFSGQHEIFSRYRKCRPFRGKHNAWMAFGQTEPLRGIVRITLIQPLYFELNYVSGFPASWAAYFGIKFPLDDLNYLRGSGFSSTSGSFRKWIFRVSVNQHLDN